MVARVLLSSCYKFFKLLLCNCYGVQGGCKGVATVGSCYRMLPVFTKELLCGSKGVATQFLKVS